MKRSARTLLFAVSVTALISAAARGAEKIVVVPLDNTPFKVQPSDYVRLTGEGIAGSTITAKITAGPAVIEGESAVVYRKGGKAPIGASYQEFMVKPTGKGTVKATITITYPNPPTPKKEIEYQFDVE